MSRLVHQATTNVPKAQFDATRTEPIEALQENDDETLPYVQVNDPKELIVGTPKAFDHWRNQDKGYCNFFEWKGINDPIRYYEGRFTREFNETLNSINDKREALGASQLGMPKSYLPFAKCWCT